MLFGSRAGLTQDFADRVGVGNNGNCEPGIWLAFRLGVKLVDDPVQKGFDRVLRDGIA